MAARLCGFVTGTLAVSGRLRKVVFVLASGAVVVFFATPAWVNVWSVITGRGFFIPAESSMFTFRVTKENGGSGEWWLYGEDGRAFYALHEKEPVYLVFPRGAAKGCAGFQVLDYHTWCTPQTRPVPGGDNR
jgi:hypothetical protein